MKQAIRWSCRIYGLLLVFYPAELRGRFRVDMTEVFEDLLSEAAVAGGSGAMASVWRTALWELFSVGLASRFESNEVLAALLSLIVSSIIAWEFFRAVG